MPTSLGVPTSVLGRRGPAVVCRSSVRPHSSTATLRVCTRGMSTTSAVYRFNRTKMVSAEYLTRRCLTRATTHGTGPQPRRMSRVMSRVRRVTSRVSELNLCRVSADVFYGKIVIVFCSCQCYARRIAGGVPAGPGRRAGCCVLYGRARGRRVGRGAPCLGPVRVATPCASVRTKPTRTPIWQHSAEPGIRQETL